MSAGFHAAADWTLATGKSFEAYGATGEVTEVDAPHRLAWTFGGERYGGYLTEEDAHEPWEEAHERYAERFGVDPTSGRALPGGSAYRPAMNR